MVSSIRTVLWHHFAICPLSCMWFQQVGWLHFYEALAHHALVVGVAETRIRKLPRTVHLWTVNDAGQYMRCLWKSAISNLIHVQWLCYDSHLLETQLQLDLVPYNLLYFRTVSHCYGFWYRRAAHRLPQIYAQWLVSWKIAPMPKSVAAYYVVLFKRSVNNTITGSLWSICISCSYLSQWVLLDPVPCLSDFQLPTLGCWLEHCQALRHGSFESKPIRQSVLESGLQSMPALLCTYYRFHVRL